VWQRYHADQPGGSVEEEIVKRYLPLVKTVVGRLAMTLPPHVDMEDLYSSGLVGLLNAVRNYDPQSGTAFETYARVRIRGAVFDELRRLDWVPRSVHTKARKVQAAMRKVEQATGRPATELEMALALRISPGEYRQWLEEIRPATFVCLDSASQPGAEGDMSPYESIADPKQENPEDGAARRDGGRSGIHPGGASFGGRRP